MCNCQTFPIKFIFPIKTHFLPKMTTRVKARETKSGEIIAYSETAIRNNSSLVEYCRTSMSALSGSTAGNCQLRLLGGEWITWWSFSGILGFTGIVGFVFYFLAVFGFWCLLLMKSGSDWQKFFISRQSLLTNGFLGGLCTYVLFWTFLYGMVHVY